MLPQYKFWETTFVCVCLHHSLCPACHMLRLQFNSNHQSSLQLFILLLFNKSWARLERIRESAVELAVLLCPFAFEEVTCHHNMIVMWTREWWCARFLHKVQKVSFPWVRGWKKPAEYFDRIKFYMERDLIQRTRLQLVALFQPFPGEVLLSFCLWKSLTSPKLHKL